MRQPLAQEARELADVMIYLLGLAEVARVDLRAG
jgi:hypothetical protein